MKIDTEQIGVKQIGSKARQYLAGFGKRTRTPDVHLIISSGWWNTAGTSIMRPNPTAICVYTQPAWHVLQPNVHRTPQMQVQTEWK